VPEGIHRCRFPRAEDRKTRGNLISVQAALG
jgi:hypothetical protein